VRLDAHFERFLNFSRLERFRVFFNQTIQDSSVFFVQSKTLNAGIFFFGGTRPYHFAELLRELRRQLRRVSRND
jgi:hypothetical protein